MIPQYRTFKSNLPRYRLKKSSIPQYRTFKLKLPKYRLKKSSIPQYRTFKLKLPKYRLKKSSIPQYRKPPCPPPLTLMFSGLLQKDLFKWSWKFGGKFSQTILLSRLSHKVYRLLSSPVMLPKFMNTPPPTPPFPPCSVCRGRGRFPFTKKTRKFRW